MSGTDIVTAAASGWIRAWVAHEINRQGVAQWESGGAEAVQGMGWGRFVAGFKGSQRSKCRWAHS